MELKSKVVQKPAGPEQRGWMATKAIREKTEGSAGVHLDTGPERGCVPRSGTSRSNAKGSVNI
jgi:hypothetical protein